MTRTESVATLYSLLLMALSASVAAQELPTVKPESVGMSSERLARIDALMQRHLRDGNIANAVTLIARDGKIVQYQAYGQLDPNTQTPMRTDTLFRMASSSKPITAVAVLMLVEEGLIRLNDPVSRFMPEFKGQRVAVLKPGDVMPAPLPPGAPATGPRPDADFVVASRDITIRDLLTHTSGLMSGGLGNMTSDLPRAPTDKLADYIPHLGQAALDFQPGTRWSYSAGAGFDTLGRIVEIVSGKPYDVFLKERVFTPLGMADTGFVVPANKQSRMNSLFRHSASGVWEAGVAPAAFASDVYFSGAGGLISTARDYARFEQMLLNGGELNGKRLLSPRTVELMQSNHVGDLFHGMRGTEDGMGFGLGVAVTLDETRAQWRRSNGSAGWFGAFGTLTWHDPRENIVGVLMIQQSNPQVQNDFGTLVMQAIEESVPAH